MRDHVNDDDKAFDDRYQKSVSDSTSTNDPFAKANSASSLAIAISHAAAIRWARPCQMPDVSLFPYEQAVDLRIG